MGGNRKVLIGCDHGPRWSFSYDSHILIFIFIDTRKLEELGAGLVDRPEHNETSVGKWYDAVIFSLLGTLICVIYLV